MTTEVKPLPLLRMPACWNNEENWRVWNRLNVLARDNPDRPLDNYCADCLPTHKACMIAAGRCGYPTVKFIRIVERQYNPRLKARRDVTTNALKGVREHAA